MAHSIRMIATDLDGVFLRDAFTPYPDNVRAMRACQDAGIPVCALTGRNWPEAKRVVKGIGFSRYCGVNGGTAILDTLTQGLRYRNRLHPDAVHALVGLLSRLEGVRFCLSGTFMNHQWTSRQMKDGAAMAGVGDLDAQTPTALHDTPEALYAASAADTQRVYVHLPRDDEKARQRLITAVQEAAPVSVRVQANGALLLWPLGADKADALRVLADIYNVRLENILVFGFGPDDEKMMREAGLRVAVSGSDAAIKQCADRVIEQSNEGAFAKAVWSMVL